MSAPPPLRARAKPSSALAHFRAFISYRQTPTDRRLAERLHRLLESFRAPRALRRPGIHPRVGRVFLDRHELKIGLLPDLIQSALERSDFLIVICSPRTPDSAWVNSEIERFLTHHPIERVLPLLVEGNPEVSFPPALKNQAPAGLPSPKLSIPGRSRMLRSTSSPLYSSAMQMSSPVPSPPADAAGCGWRCSALQP